jgi:hypothetical protein
MIDGVDSVQYLNVEHVEPPNLKRGRTRGRPSSPSVAAADSLGAGIGRPKHVMLRRTHGKGTTTYQRPGAGGDMHSIASPNVQLAAASNGMHDKEEIGTLSPTNDPFRF